ncbi:hypothetical protein TrLO_g974 [Triparma laevis f. longispina]|uniref:AMP-dependent synthetase/ligase domain-containing protein n=1 Tax=Triparma laevis f. longispina TaxID=1714387 RepID=A0A9W7L0Y5_9STRA|nr:hypothetical protein TrLO_g974 [Triparma laevis f. longispina]
MDDSSSSHSSPLPSSPLTVSKLSPFVAALSTFLNTSLVFVTSLSSSPNHAISILACRHNQALYTSSLLSNSTPPTASTPPHCLISPLDLKDGHVRNSLIVSTLSSSYGPSTVVFDEQSLAAEYSHLFPHSVVIILSTLFENVKNNVNDVSGDVSATTFVPLSPPSSLLAHHIISTSGTTSKPSLTKLSNASINAYCESRIQVENIQSSSTILQLSLSTFDPSISDVTLFHLLNCSLVLYSPQSSLPINDNINDLIKQNKVTHIMTTKGITSTLKIIPRPPLKVLSIGGEHVSQSFINTYARHDNNNDNSTSNSTSKTTRLILNYGLTELGVYQFSGEVFKYQIEHVGLPLKDFEVEFVDVDEERGWGEIVMRGGWIDDCMGYVEEENSSSSDFGRNSNRIVKNGNKNNFEGNWRKEGYRTGDLGYINPEGNLIIKGRINSLEHFKVNGVLISSSEIIENFEESIENCRVYVLNEPFTVYVVIFEDSTPKWYRKNALLNKIFTFISSTFLRSTVRVPNWITYIGPSSHFNSTYLKKTTTTRTGKTISSKSNTLASLPPLTSSTFSDSLTPSLPLTSPLGLFTSHKIKTILNLTTLPTSNQTFTELGGDSLAASRVIRGCWAEWKGVEDGRKVGGVFGSVGVWESGLKGLNKIWKLASREV